MENPQSLQGILDALLDALRQETAVETKTNRCVREPSQSSYRRVDLRIFTAATPGADVKRKVVCGADALVRRSGIGRT
jgi:hypothetical protein